MSGLRFGAGFAARIRPDLLLRTSQLLVGGSPLRALRLSDRAQALVHGDRVVVTDAASAQVAARLLDGNLAEPEPRPGLVEAAELTVVVPVRDRSEALDRCLRALAPLECVVVDDASLDPGATAEVARRHGAAVVALTRNVGPAAARNAGLARVRTPYVAFVDSDVVVGADQLLALGDQFADEQLLLVGPRVQGVARSGRPRWFERYDAAASSLDLGHASASVRPGATVAWLPSACLVGRTAGVRSLGGFDERMRVGEDVDLVWRAVRAGWVVRYDPAHRAAHDVRPSLLGWLGRKLVYGTGGAALAERHGDWTAPAVLSPTAALGAAAVLARRRWSVPVATAAVLLTAASLRRTLPAAPGAGWPLSIGVAVRGLGWAVRQESALLLRHWWPATALAGTVSPRLRRAVLTSLLVDALVHVPADRRRPVDLCTALAARRLDDLAYGAGLWLGVARHPHPHAARCLLPRRPDRRKPLT